MMSHNIMSVKIIQRKDQNVVTILQKLTALVVFEHTFFRPKCWFLENNSHRVANLSENKRRYLKETRFANQIFSCFHFNFSQIWVVQMPRYYARFLNLTMNERVEIVMSDLQLLKMVKPLYLINFVLEQFISTYRRKIITFNAIKWAVLEHRS